MAQNNDARMQGIITAADRAAQQAATTGVDPGALADAAAAGGGAPAGGDTGGGAANRPGSYVDPVTQAIIQMTPQRQNFLNYGLRSAGGLF